MREVIASIPDADVLLALSLEELGEQILAFLQERDRRGELNGAGITLTGALSGFDTELGQQPHYGHQQGQVKEAFREAWAWLEIQVLLMPSEGMNGTNGWRVLSRRGRDLNTVDRIAAYRAAQSLPRAQIHPSIADAVWLSFVRGEYEVAAFQALRQVEIAIREASGLTGLFGVALARRAFKPFDERTGEAGALTESTADAGEQQGMMDLFAGALGALKNPHSHRIVAYDDPAEASAVIMLGSQLLRIIDRRGAAA